VSNPRHVVLKALSEKHLAHGLQGPAAPDTTLVLRLAMDIIQWPAMLVTIAAAWFAASHVQVRRRIGFWLFLVSNVLWVIWGVHAQAWALIILQIFLAFTNIRGARNNDPEVEEE
jgi:hypothetical protein